MPHNDQSEMVCTILRHHGITATLAENIREAIQWLEASASAFLLLDLDLDGANLFLDAIVSNFYDPPPYLLIVGNYSGSAERIDALNRGADVCLDKPVDAEEVAAVINAVFRRTLQMQRKGIKLAPCITHKQMTVDPLRRIVLMEGRRVDLTTKEFDTLYLLASYPGVVFTKGQIYKHIWNDDYEFTTTSVTDIISSLRRKLGLSSKDGQYIQTKYNSGYRFATE